MATVIDWIKRAAVRRSLDNRPGDAAATERTPAAANDVALRYANLGEIARGGMGAIVKVYDREIRRELVMKAFDPADGKVDAGRIGLFVEEAQITGQLDHPNICPVHDIGADTAGTRFFTMKMVRGKTLADVVHDVSYDPMNPHTLRSAVEIVLKVCDALAFAHAKGVVHRDLKPENVMVGGFGEVYLMDFGVAKLKAPALPSVEARVTVARTTSSPIDEAGAIVGTLSYMAPEQARGDTAAVDERSDVFGLGAILYEVLTQVPPYYATDLGQLVLQAQSASWRAPQELCGVDVVLPSALCAIVEKAMSPEPADRYPSVVALRDALVEFLSGGLSFPTRTIAAGECVINEGDEGHEAFILQRGYCRVYKHLNGEMVALADLKPGDVFGEASVFADTPRTATIQALTDVTVQVVTRDVFTKDLGLASAVGKFVGALAARFVSVDRELSALKQAATSASASAAPTEATSTASTNASTDSSHEAPQNASPVSETPAPVAGLPPVGMVRPGSPLQLVDVAVTLQSLANRDQSVQDLMLEALVIGAQELVRRRRELDRSAAAE